MKIVTFVREMRPYNVGDTRVVPDDVAAQLVACGDVKDPPASFPLVPSTGSPAPAEGEAPRRRKPQTYLTKAASALRGATAAAPQERLV